MKDGYEKMLWVQIDDEDIKKNADHYQKITNRLIRTLPANPIVDELKELVETFKEAMLEILEQKRAPERVIRQYMTDKRND